VKVESIPGVTLGRLKRFPDSRGSFAEAWRASGGSDLDPFVGVQANLSSSARGVLRGLHLHQRQLDRWIVLDGVAFVALVDLRPMVAGDATEPSVMSATLRKDETVVIPPGVAHGFLAVEPIELLYIVTNEYDGTDELGFAWDDRLVSVEWPKVATVDGRPIVSDRDQSNPPVVDLVSRLRAEPAAF
jgi:dTDP-4-dehydrorhamnose 3,5-epimerase